jgi:hypothetical protein
MLKGEMNHILTSDLSSLAAASTLTDVLFFLPGFFNPGALRLSLFPLLRLLSASLFLAAFVASFFRAFFSARIASTSTYPAVALNPVLYEIPVFIFEAREREAVLAVASARRVRIRRDRLFNVGRVCKVDESCPRAPATIGSLTTPFIGTQPSTPRFRRDIILEVGVRLVLVAGRIIQEACRRFCSA